ncbi:putative integral membrane protein [Microbacterium esteraromaticum]|uniref:Putative integral membrane protein n=1 Tax=Microbacterium esteraromaticum TaxID=57043 RepID=A0A1R4J318_9MICO|nr:hypothetical protein [Microbacterium esteraromaticum]SJN26083.1 putative integral membrane protein [Microbacterium esteraromaticum]
MNAGWMPDAIARLSDARTCPVCEAAELVDWRCPHCGADVTGHAGTELWRASASAAESLRTRAVLLARVPRAVPALAGPVAAGPAPTLSTAASAAIPGRSMRSDSAAVTTTAAARPATDGASLQSVLATAGAALFAVAAIVFTFFNPDLADRGVRNWIIGAVTLAFLGGAWLLARRRLQFSAEAVGGLALVFVGLDVHAVASSVTGIDAGWASASVATAVAGALMLAAALRARIRIWLWTSLLALAVAPAMLGFASSNDTAAALGAAASAFAATGLMALLPRFAARFPARIAGGHEAVAAPRTAGPVPTADAVDRAISTRRALAGEAAALTVLQIVVTMLSALRVVFTGAEPLAIATVLAVLAVHAVLAAVRTIPRVWAFLGGVLVVSAGAFFASALPAAGAVEPEWAIAVVPAGAVLALLVCAIVPLPRRTPRIPMSVGAGLVAGMTSAPAVLYGALVGSDLLRVVGARAETGALSADHGPVFGSTTWPLILGLAVISTGFGVFALLARRRVGIRPLRLAALIVAALYAIASTLTLAASHVLPLQMSIAVLLVIASTIAAVLARGRTGGATIIRVLLVIGCHLALLVAVALAWQDRTFVPAAGIATLLALAVIARAIPTSSRFVHVGVGYGYALVLVGTALSMAGVGGIALLCLTTSAGLLGAVVATFVPRVGARNWQAMLVVASVPLAIGIVQVMFERSGWTALSTGLMFVLALVLLLTRRKGLTIVIRTLAAGALIPALAVVILSLGAQLLVQSGSPVVLPVIAALIALVLPSSRMIRDGLVARGFLMPTAEAARAAIEISALLTGTIAVVLCLTREAAGFGTACLVLILLGTGAGLTSLVARRRYGWWAAAVAFTGALWSLWALNDVGLPEAYLLPPALGAAVVAVLLTLRGARAVPLFAAGLAGAVGPVLALIIAADAGRVPAAVPWRAYGLLAGGWMLVGLAAIVGRAARPHLRRLRPLRLTALLIASLAALGATAQAVRWGSGLDISPVRGGDAGLFLMCIGLSALSALVLFTAARMLHAAAASASPEGRPGIWWIPARWMAVPAALAFSAGVWPAIASDWFVIWGMWLLMLGWLAVMVWAAFRAMQRPSSLLPPVGVLFTIAFITAVVAWSPRELRVEMFSLPLGLFLLVAGALGLRGGSGEDEDAGARAWRLADWPRGWHGSWPLLAPGLIVMTSASVVSTFTDPLTWRAILVMGLALAATLIGAARRLAAPFVIGLIVLPIENVFVFSVQIGRGIESMPWWITLATVGAVLLIIAVTSERRTGATGTVAVRVRDLR